MKNNWLAKTRQRFLFIQIQQTRDYFTYDLVDADEVFAHDASHLAHDYGVAFVCDLFDQGGEELSL